MKPLKLSDRVYNLRFIQRYSLTPRSTSETVAEHSFYVAVIVMELYEKYEFNLGEALSMAISHDFAECEIGDITLTAKLNNPQLVKVVSKAEDRVMESFGPFIYGLHKKYLKRNSPEALIVKYADILQVKQYVDNEKMIGNYLKDIDRNTIKALKNFKKKIKKFKRKS